MRSSATRSTPACARAVFRAAVFRAAVLRAAVFRAAGFRAADLLEAGLLASSDCSTRACSPRAFEPPSSAATRRASFSTSPRRPLRSSSTPTCSIISRTRTAAPATSSTRSCARVRVDWALSAVAWNVFSTAERTAPTASAPGLSFFFDFFLSFLAMAAQV